MPDLPTLAKQQRDALDAQNTSEEERIIASFRDMTDRLEGDIDALSRDLADGPTSIENLPSYKRLMKDTARELETYQAGLIRELAILASLWLNLGVSQSSALIQQAGIDEGIEIEPVLFDDLLLASLNRYLQEGSPLWARLQEYGVTNAQRIRDIILGMGANLNPRQIARLIVSNGLGMALTDALRMARTLKLYAYREAALLNYRQYDVIKGWVWMSALLPGRTCMSCVNMHGTIHGLDEILNDHHNGLCAMIPYLGGRNPITQGGEEWFSNQPRAVQMRMMGKGKYDAWVSGKISISNMTGEHDDPVYGLMRIEKSLKELTQ